MTVAELKNLRGQFIEAGSMPFSDFQELLKVCWYGKAETALALETRSN